MALIKCPECGKEISDKAKTCIQCGCPMTAFSEPQRLAVENNIVLATQNKKSKLLSFLTVINVLLFALWLFVSYVIYTSDKKHGVNVSWGEISLSFTEYYNSYIDFLFGELFDFQLEYGVCLICLFVIIFLIFTILTILTRIFVFNSSFIFSDGKIVGKAIFNKKIDIDFSAVKKVKSALYNSIVIYTTTEKYCFVSIKNKKEIINYFNLQLSKSS